MRRLAAPLLVGLGVFLLALAVLLPTVVLPRVEKTPLDTYNVVRVTGPGTYFNPETRAFVESAEATVTRVARGDVKQSSDDVAVFDYTQTVEVEGLEAPLNVIAERVRFDRSTGLGVGGRGDRPNHEGVQVVKFPFNTKKGEYQLHEPSAAKAFPVRFERETEVDGLKVYEFRGTVPDQIGSSLGVPGALVGAPEAATVFVEEVYSNSERVVLVEPRTGSVVSATSKPKRAWRPVAIGGNQEPGSEAVLFAAELTPTEETTKKLVSDAKDRKRKLTLVGRTLPIVLGLVGLLVLVAGLLLLSRGRRERRAEHATL